MHLQQSLNPPLGGSIAGNGFSEVHLPVSVCGCSSGRKKPWVRQSRLPRAVSEGSQPGAISRPHSWQKESKLLAPGESLGSAPCIHHMTRAVKAKGAEACKETISGMPCPAQSSGGRSGAPGIRVVMWGLGGWPSNSVG